MYIEKYGEYRYCGDVEIRAPSSEEMGRNGDWRPSSRSTKDESKVTYRDRVSIRIDLTRTPVVEVAVEEALMLFKCLEEETGGSRDLAESINILNSFNEYLRIAKRKFLDYITPSRDQREVLEGRSIVHKLKLSEKGDAKIVEVFFDRRFNVELIRKCLLGIGFKEVVIEYSS